MSKFIASTLAAPVEYAAYSNADIPTVTSRVVIAGGAGVANKNLITPRGVITEVSDEEAAFLDKHELFNLHRKNGFVSILDSRVDGDTAAADMTGRDNSAPLVDADFDADKVPNHTGKTETVVPAAKRR